MPDLDHPIDVSEAAGVRYLHFGSDWVQGAMRIARPYSLELAYTREMMAGLLLRERDPWPEKLLLIGLGAGSLTKFAWRHLPRCQVTVVEINPRVAAMARQCFKLPEAGPCLDYRFQDGAHFVAQARAAGERYDWILVDGFDPQARAGALDRQPFYRDCAALLGPRGLLGVNFLGRSRGFGASVARLEEAFPGRTLVFPSCDSGNAIAFAAVGERVDVSQEELKERAQALKAATGLNLLPTLARLEQAGHFQGRRLVL